MLKRLSRQYLAIGCLALLTTACGGGGGGGGSDSSKNAPTRAPSSAPTPTPTPSPAPAPAPSPSPTPSPSVNHSVHLSWTMPRTRADGSPLGVNQLAGYRLFYTRDNASTNEGTVVNIDSGETTSASIALTIADTYTFAITAVDSNGIESALSDMVRVTID